MKKIFIFNILVLVLLVSCHPSSTDKDKIRNAMIEYDERNPSFEILNIKSIDFVGKWNFYDEMKSFPDKLRKSNTNARNEFSKIFDNADKNNIIVIESLILENDSLINRIDEILTEREYYSVERYKVETKIEKYVKVYNKWMEYDNTFNAFIYHDKDTCVIYDLLPEIGVCYPDWHLNDTLLRMDSIFTSNYIRILQYCKDSIEISN